MNKKYFEANFEAKKVTDFLNKQLLALKDISPLMLCARRFMKQTVDENFETEGTHTGEKWKEWSDSYKKQRLAMGRSEGGILSYIGKLRSSIQAEHGKDWAKVGTIKEYAAVHNYGFDGIVQKKSSKGKIFSCHMRMPKREFMRFDDYAKEELLAELYIAAKEMLIDKELKKKVYGE